MPVGFFDSGLGGLTILDAVSRRLPELSAVYFGDNANAPYGTRSQEEILELTRAGIKLLWKHGCDLVILACNTASAAALRRIQEGGLPEGKRVLGVFVPMIEVLTERCWGDNSPPRNVEIERVALFATPATVSSRAFQRELAFRAIGVDVEAQPCRGLVEAIEDGEIEYAEALARGHAESLVRRMPTPQAVVLACTHYPIVADVFRDMLGKNVRYVNQPEVIAESLADYLARHTNMHGSSKGSRFLTSGDANSVSGRATRLMRKHIVFTSWSSKGDANG